MTYKKTTQLISDEVRLLIKKLDLVNPRPQIRNTPPIGFP